MQFLPQRRRRWGGFEARAISASTAVTTTAALATTTTNTTLTAVAAASAAETTISLSTVATPGTAGTAAPATLAIASNTTALAAARSAGDEECAASIVRQRWDWPRAPSWLVSIHLLYECLLKSVPLPESAATTRHAWSGPPQFALAAAASPAAHRH